MAENTRTGGADDCWIWIGVKDRHGYGTLYAEGRRDAAHRWAYTQANGPIPIGLGVLHRCDNPPCVNPSHLFLGTQSDNNGDAKAKGRSALGERNARATLTASKVQEIRIRRAGGESTVVLAQSFHVNVRTIRSIVSRQKWRHI